MNLAQFVLENAASKPETVREELVKLHKSGENVSDILQFVRELETKKIKVPHPGWEVFDICGTGGSGKSRINLSTVLAIKLSEHFAIAKHGNKAASGRVGSFDLIENAGYVVGDTPEKVTQQLTDKNLSFVFAPLNPVPLAAQMVGVNSIEAGDLLSETAQSLNKSICFVHDTAFGLDDVSIGGATKFWMTGLADKKIHPGVFFPEDYGCTTVKDFADIQGGGVDTNLAIAKNLLAGTATKAQQDFLDINQRVATEFFNNFMP